MLHELYSRIDASLIEPFQIIPSRLRDLDESKIRIYWAHDLPEERESLHFKDGGWAKFDRIVFVSNWQMQAYIHHFGIPWSKCVVLHNAIEPIEPHEKPSGALRLLYTATPHRGLGLLLAAFEVLCERYPELELDVFSSFKLYGMGSLDAAYQELFDRCRAHPRIHYHGAVPNAEVRAVLQQSHIFAYPSIWRETSCLGLMEAMSAGLACVHPNLAALPETAGNFTAMYGFHEDPVSHGKRFYFALDAAIRSYHDPESAALRQEQKRYVDRFYSWDLRAKQWRAFLESLLAEKRR